MKIQKLSEFIKENNINPKEEIDMIPFSRWLIFGDLNCCGMIFSNWTNELEPLNEDYILLTKYPPLNKEQQTELKRKYKYINGELIEVEK